MLKLISYVFPGVWTATLYKKALNVTSLTNPITLSKNVTLVVIDCCASPPLRLTAHYLSAALLLAASCVMPNSITFGSFIHVITEIYENCWNVLADFVL